MLLAFGMFTAVPAQALTLQHAVDAALVQDPGVQRARYQVEEALQQRKFIRSSLLPSLSAQGSATTGRTRTSDENNTRYHNTAAGLNLTIPVYRGEDLERLAQADIAEVMARTQLQEATQTLIAEVARSYFAVLTAEDDMAVIRAQRTAIEAQLETARENFAKGNASVTDQQEAQSRLDLNMAQLVAARHTLVGRQAAFQQLTGLSAQGLNRFDATKPLPTVASLQQSYWEDLAVRQHFEVKRAKLEVRDARHELARAKAAHRPTVSIVSQLGSMNGQDERRAGSAIRRSRDASAMLQVQIPLYSGGGLMAQERAGVAALGRSESTLEGARRAAKQQARDALLTLQSSVHQVRALEAAVESSALMLQSTRLGYGAGMRISVDVLNAQQQLFDAHRNLSNTRYEVLLNLLQLKAAVGSLSNDDVSLIDSHLKVTGS